jgi:hypothetical protein
MQDPNPENIMGQKQVSHSVEWRINVGYALLAVLGLYLAWKAFGFVSGGDTDTDDVGDEIEETAEEFAGTEVPVSGGGLTA